MPIEVSSTSRFRNTEPIVADGVDTFGMLNRFSFLDVDSLNETDIIEFVVDGSSAGRPDLISTRVYGIPFLSWVVILASNPENPLNWPLTHTVLKLPSKSVVFAEL